MPDDLNALFSQLKAQAAPVPPPLADVQLTGSRLRRRRHLAVTSGVSAAAVLVASVGLALAGRLKERQAPAVSPTVATSSPDPVTSAVPAPSTSTGASTTVPGETTSIPRLTAGTTGYADFLHPGDLGTQWIIDEAPLPDVSPHVPSCSSGRASTTSLTQATRHQGFVAVEPAGLWRVQEVLTQVTPTQASTLRARLASATTCTPAARQEVAQQVVAAGDGLLVIGTVLPAGQLGDVTGYAVRDRSYLVLGFGQALGGIADYPLPGQAPWAVARLLDAVERATGTRPPAPTVRAAFRTPSTAVPPSPGPLLLQQTDLGMGAWSRAYVPVWSTDPKTQRVSLPSCAAAGSTATAQAPETSGTGWFQEYQGFSGDGPGPTLDNLWSLHEFVVTLSAAEAERARAAIEAAAGCDHLRGDAGLAPPPRVPNPAGTKTMVVAATSSGGALQYGKAWALSGTRLVVLSTATKHRFALGSRPDTTLQGPSWLTELTVTALRRATTP